MFLGTNCIRKCELFSGVPQGSVVSPIIQCLFQLRFLFYISCCGS